jgi:alanyl-tRNA synthetase
MQSIPTLAYTCCNMPAAQRLYFDKPDLFDFRARVTDIREFARKDGVQVWQIALDRTAFFPAGGGQPHDRGVLRAKARSGAELTVTVEDVQEDEAGEVWHSTTKPLLAGTDVEATVDTARRLDHAQQHSGQHLLSAVLANDFGLRTLSFHLGQHDATIDLDVDGQAAQAAVLEQLSEVELRVNRHVRSNLPVQLRWVGRLDAEKLLADGALRKLPPIVGDIRLVEVPGLDLNACGGTHVQALGEIGSVLLRGTERVKKALRLHFVCGPRAVQAARADWAELGATATSLSVGTHGVRSAVEKLRAEVRSLGKERTRLREELAGSHAVQLAVEEKIQNGLRLVVRTFQDRDGEYVKLLAKKLLEAVPHTAAVLASSAQDPATLVVASNLAANADRPTGCQAVLREVLAPWKLPGGGTAEMAQAQVPKDLLEIIVQTLVSRMTAL